MNMTETRQKIRELNAQGRFGEAHRLTETLARVQPWASLEPEDQRAVQLHRDLGAVRRRLEGGADMFGAFMETLAATPPTALPQPPYFPATQQERFDQIASAQSIRQGLLRQALHGDVNSWKGMPREDALALALDAETEAARHCPAP